MIGMIIIQEHHYLSYNIHRDFKTMIQDQPVIEVEVRKWDAHSFTIEGVNDRLEKILKDQTTIRTLALRNNGIEVRISRDVKLKGRRDFSPGAEDAYWNPPNQGTTFEYEGLD
jgi:N-dimethylarginine dimethylaminohydrolase